MEKEHLVLEFSNVSVARQGKRILDSVSFSLERGEHLAILGPNGSGKSTIINAIIKKFFPLDLGPDSGIKIFGQKDWNVFELRALLGIVSSGLQEDFFREMTVKEAVLSGFFSSIGLFTNHHVTAKMKKKAKEVLDFVEIGHLSNRLMNEISTGEARRVLIGRALVHDPEAMVLDEPMNALDMHALHSFRDFIRKLARSGKTIIIVTHNLSDIIPEINRVMLLKNGRVIADGEKAKILTAGRLSKLFSVPVKISVTSGYFHAVIA